MKPFTTILTLDFETRFSSKDFSLSKMTTESYVRDPRFHAFGCCIHEFGAEAPTIWVTHNKLEEVFAEIDWTTTAVIMHNASFDAAILSWIYDVHPCFIFDTLSMSRAVRGTEAGNSLAKLAMAYGLPEKGKALSSTDGREYLPPSVEHELAEYCAHDVFLTEEVFKRLSPGYPAKELQLIDMTVKMYTEPKLILDAKMLQISQLDENTKLADALLKAKAKEEDLASNERFGDLLRSYGIEPPMKVSKQTGKPALALAKTDAHFQQLLNGDNEEVALLCEARLRVKSTQARTRSQRFLDIASRGALPIPLNYAATNTLRFGGTQQINLQNMKRGSPLRKAIMAPKGQVVVVGDLSQIEVRVLSWLAGYKEMLDIFKGKDDPYAVFGRTMFSKPDLTKQNSPLLRQSAKSAALGCQFQMGFSNFAAQLLVGFLGAPPIRYTREQAKQLGVTQALAEKFVENPNNIWRMQEIPHVCTEQELLIHCIAAKAIIDKYRATAAPIVDFWNLLTELIPRSLMDGKEYNHKGVLLFRKEEIVLVSGMSLKYPGLRREKDDEGKMQYVYNAGKKVEKLYGGRITNHVTQSTARIVMTDAMLRVGKRYQVLLTCHDEFAIAVLESEAEEAKAFVYEQMIQTPVWMPGIPLDAEVGYAQRYGEAKS